MTKNIASIQTWQSGGNVMVDIVTLTDGRILTITEECCIVHKNQKAMDEYFDGDIEGATEIHFKDALDLNDKQLAVMLAYDVVEEGCLKPNVEEKDATFVVLTYEEPKHDFARIVTRNGVSIFCGNVYKPNDVYATWSMHLWLKMNPQKRR